MIVRAAWVFALMLIACSACAAELGRMFYTPAQRATLDAAQVDAFDAALATWLDACAAPAFTVRHRIDAHVLHPWPEPASVPPAA